MRHSRCLERGPCGTAPSIRKSSHDPLCRTGRVAGRDRDLCGRRYDEIRVRTASALTAGGLARGRPQAPDAGSRRLCRACARVRGEDPLVMAIVEPLLAILDQLARLTKPVQGIDIGRAHVGTPVT